MKDLQKIIAPIHGQSPENALHALANAFPGKVIFSSSLGYEDQAITHLIFSNNIPIKIFTLDTGRLFDETHAVLKATTDRYKKDINIYHPQPSEVEKLVSEKGPNSFYESVENRKECCFIRKVEPLQRALKGNEIWVTGIRSEQSADRKEMPMVEWDETNKIAKFHPLLNWTFEEVKNYVNKNNIPHNPLHDKGFVSIGCSPCTRAIKPGENFRSGRWWWEDSTKKECGLHINEKNKN